MQPLFAEFTPWHYLYTIGLSLLSIFLILVILVQRGRGGGLTGALGGMGGQSAFGTKAGDLFTKITIVVAILWGLSAMAVIRFVGSRSQTGGLSDVRSTSPEKTPTEKDRSAEPKTSPGLQPPPAETKSPPGTKPTTEVPAKTAEDSSVKKTPTEKRPTEKAADK